MANLMDWLTAIATVVAGSPNRGLSQLGTELGVPEITRRIAHHLSPGSGASFNLSLGDEVAILVCADPLLMQSGVYPVSPQEVRQLGELVTSLGKNIFEQTQSLVATVSHPQMATVRLTAARQGNDYTFALRCNVPQQLGLDELVRNGTLTSQIAEFLLLCLIAAPSTTLIICGPAACGKSTLLNALVSEWQSRMATMSFRPTMSIWAGDAVDVVVPPQTTLLVGVRGEHAVALIKRCNTAQFIVGEVVTETSLRVFEQAQTAASKLLTTTHGKIAEAASLFPSGNVFVEMLSLGRRRVVATVAADPESMLRVPISAKPGARYIQSGDRRLLVVFRYSIADDTFVAYPEAGSIWNILQSIQRRYY